MTLLDERPVATAFLPVPGRPLPVVGAGRRAPLATGGTTAYADLDVAASAPCLQAVADAVAEALPWYASVHRGAGYASQVSTELLEQARAGVAGFLGCRPGDQVVFTRNTTDAFALLAHCLPAGTTVVSYASEHHANLLPWRGHAERGGRHVLLAVPASPQAALDALEGALRGLHGPVLVAVTGASNVTGEVWPVEQVVALARRYGARVAVDAAQLAPHRVVDLRALGADWVALSGHKLYAPYGAGVLAGRADWLDAAGPYLPGGGATTAVTTAGQAWAAGPARHEGGTPNVLGAVAIAVACAQLEAAGRAALERREHALLARLEAGLASVPGLRVHRLWGEAVERIGVATFTVEGWDPALLATALSAEHGVGVRHGRFCAHPLVDALLDCERPVDGCGDAASGTALRASIGVATTEADVDALVGGLRALTQAGPRAQYTRTSTGWAVASDARPSAAGTAARILRRQTHQ
ncbi:aminotransferase class V-fold PLP-dependent enzyme [Motilibacter deserti]|uniref:Aminotransferase class V-fold PLP-dependent enzyme n=1 Tax=Motilibacter deserti TaxID=2714956 RepID=A0ABX0GTM2_9ACTN|nr:aminotransferase class V-fold PLP-dependent enzyme [Motilibacter deserti]NHC13004.1 aminotransferase class V-fold PLP-dependent enzyme [Motilibacter deserti]